MKLPVAAMALLTIVIVTFACAVVAWLGLDRQMAMGVGAGLLAGAVLAFLGGRGLGRALKHTHKGALLVHMYGGFLLRLALLVVGFSAVAASGVANPVGFAVAFLAGTVIALLRQVMMVGSERDAPAGDPAFGR